MVADSLIALFLGFVLDQILGDPEKWPHPVVGFGKLISFFEERVNNGRHRIIKGGLVTVVLVALIFILAFTLIQSLYRFNFYLVIVVESVLIFYCLSAKTLRTEVKLVFQAVERSLDDGREQVARIVGRDTSALNAQQIRTAALETLAENLSDGVIAPLFWFAILGVPGMLSYKMINTLDSMIGYKNERYLYFGRFAARLDDVANYIPARITAFMMLLVAGKMNKAGFVTKFGKCHTSPNSGYPEAALAAILDCRFGGPNTYFGKQVEKPYIGINEKNFVLSDMQYACTVNKRTEWIMLLLIIAFKYLFFVLCNDSILL